MTTSLDAPPAPTQTTDSSEPAITQSDDTIVTPDVVPSDAPQTSVDPVTEFDWSKAVNPDGSFSDSARDAGIPEHVKSVGGMLKSYKDIQRMKGAPGEEATPEQLSAFRLANGIPEVVNAESYGLQLPDELKDSIPAASLDRVAKAANDNAHMGHVEMMKAVVAEFGALELEHMAANSVDTEAEQERRLQEASSYLDKDENFKGQNRSAALTTTANGLNAALGDLGVASDSPEAQALRGFLAENPLGTRILHHFVSKTSQDSMPGTDTQDFRAGGEKADDIMSNPHNPLYEAFHDDAHEMHEKAVKQYYAYMGVSQ